MKRLILWIIFLPILLFLLLQLYFFVQICWWIKYNPSSTSFMRHQLEVLQEKNPQFQLQHKWVPYARISNNLKRAVISSEDDGFSEHEGVDWEAMQNPISFPDLGRGMTLARVLALLTLLGSLLLGAL